MGETARQSGLCTVKKDIGKSVGTGELVLPLSGVSQESRPHGTDVGESTLMVQANCSCPSPTATLGWEAQ